MKNGFKTFAQLTAGDKIYECQVGSMEYSVKTIDKVDSTTIHFGYGSSLPRSQEKVSEKGETYYNKATRYFTHESMAIRYCKAQMMKHLFSLIDGAKKSIKAVHDFRGKNIELLNHQWTEEQINILEKSL